MSNQIGRRRTQYSYGMIDYIIADGMKFACDGKKKVLETGGILMFKPIRETAGPNFLRFPQEKKHGDAVQMEPGTVYVDDKSHDMLTPICTDPRVMYIAYHGYDLLENGPTDDLIKRWQADIPTREKAMRWLIENKKKADCIPFDCMCRIIQKQEAK